MSCGQISVPLGALVLIFCSASANGAFVNLQNVDGRDGYSTSTLAGPYTLRPAGQNSYLVGRGFGSLSYQWRTALEYDVRQVGGIVDSASLAFPIDFTLNPPFQFQVHGYHGDGTVAASDLSTSNPITGLLTAPQGFPPYPSIDITDYVRAQRLAGRSHIGIVFSGLSDTSTGGMSILATATFLNPTLSAPEIRVTYTVPEPTTLAILLMCPMLARRCRLSRTA